MDRRLSGRLVSTIPVHLTRINIRLDSEKDIIDTFRQIEQNHWAYLDQYRDKDSSLYPTITIRNFALELIKTRYDVSVNMGNIERYIRLYGKYKKSIPTAGVILYHYKDNAIYFVVVRMRFQKIWSMPKGKKEPGEDILTTACREFREETGIDLEDLIDSDTPCRKIGKTWFYLIESDQMTPQFDGFNDKEVEKVKWINASTVVRNFTQYSKQAVETAKYLLNLR